jgi:copper chaperone CopZ
MKFNKVKTILMIVAIVCSSNAFAQITKGEIVATGLTCSMCSNAINKQFKKLAEVDSVATDLNTNTFVVYLKKENKLKPRVLKESVEKAGFFVGSLVITVPSDNLKTGDNKTFSLDGSTFIFLNEETQKSDGETKLKIHDKGYITQKEHKKLLKTFSKMATYSLENEDDYHIKIIK